MLNSNTTNGHAEIVKPHHEPATSAASIFVVEEDNFARIGLCLILQGQPAWTVVAESSLDAQARTRILQLQPDLVIVGIGTPHEPGLEFVKSLLRSAPNLRALVLADQGQSVVERAFAVGVLGYVPKQHADTELLSAVEALLQGRIFFSALAALQLRTQYQQCARKYPMLSRREMTIVQLLSQGKTNKEVATALGLSCRTAENHRATIMRKLKLKTFSELVRYAVREGMIEP